MDVKTLRREMNQFFSKVESLQRSLSKFGGKSEAKVDRKKKKEPRPAAGK
jgi:hypothetical protein